MSDAWISMGAGVPSDPCYWVFSAANRREESSVTSTKALRQPGMRFGLFSVVQGG